VTLAFFFLDEEFTGWRGFAASGTEVEGRAEADKEAALLLRACAPSDARQWAMLLQHERQIEHIFSGEVQRSESGAYTSVVQPRAAAAGEPAGAGAGGAGAGGGGGGGGGGKGDAPLPTAFDGVADVRSLLFEVSPHTRRVHVYVRAGGRGGATGLSFSRAELMVERERMRSDGEPVIDAVGEPAMDATTAAQSTAARRALGAKACGDEVKACGDEVSSGEEAEESEEAEELAEELAETRWAT
jgi:hypothetical protein